MGLSPGVDFETKLFFKPDAARLLERELSAKGYACKPVHIGGKHRSLPTGREGPSHHTRRAGGAGAVQSPAQHHHQIGPDRARRRHPFAYGSGGGWRGPSSRSLRLTASSLAPWSPGPRRRPGGWRRCATWPRAGAVVGVLFAPVIPGTERSRIGGRAGTGQGGWRVERKLCGSAPAAGDQGPVSPMAGERNGPTAPAGSCRWCARCAAAGDYDPDWAQRMKGSGPVADLIRQRFKRASARLGAGCGAAAVAYRPVFGRRLGQAIR